MNLTYEIVKHILNKLGVFNDLNTIYTSIRDPDFLQDKKITLINEENDEEIENSIWSCKLSFDVKKFRIMFADVSIAEKECVLLVSLEGSPEYACFFSEAHPELTFIATYNNGVWVHSTIYVQAAFLTGMEQIKDLSIPWKPNNDIDDLYEKLVSFINYYDGILS